MSELRRLLESFPKPKREEWTTAASSEISGGNPTDNLRWKTADDLDFGPFYSQEDIKGLTYLQQFQLNGIVREAEPYQWVNMPAVKVSDAVKANTAALAHLRQEADGVIFYLPDAFTDYHTLLNEISWEHCSVSFVGDAAAGKALQAFVKTTKLDLTKLQGGFFSREIIPGNMDVTNSAFRSSGILVEPSTPVNEIVAALIAGNRIIESSKTNEIATTIRKIGFSLPIGQQLLVEISKLKALRMLWYQVAQAYGANELKASDLYIHGRSEPFTHEKFQPHGNMLKSTMAAIAAICGGANALTIEPEDIDHPMMSRIARNVSVILKLESQLGKVHDPFAGAYGIEVLVDKIAQEAWSKFQSLL